MAEAERAWARRLEEFRDGRVNPRAPDHIELTMTPDELLAALAEGREANLTVLDGLAADGATPTSQHPEWGGVTLGHFLNGWTAHDLQHTVQAEEALMQPLIRRSGVWRQVFADHDLEARAGHDSS